MFSTMRMRANNKEKRNKIIEYFSYDFCSDEEKKFDHQAESFLCIDGDNAGKQNRKEKKRRGITFDFVQHRRKKRVFISCVTSWRQ